MKAVVLSDFAVLKSYLVKLALGFVALGTLATLIIGNAPLMPLFVGIILPFSALNVLLLRDDQRHWEGFRLALPLTRADVARGRYATFAAVIGFGVASGLVAVLLAWMLYLLVPGAASLARMPAVFDVQALVLFTAAAIVLPLASMAIALPPVMRFGMTKATQFVPLAFMLLYTGVWCARNQIMASSDAIAGFVNGVAELAQTPAGLFVVAIVPLTACVALYLVSCGLSVKLYEKREF